MAVSLGNLHTKLKLASFKPLHAGKATEKARVPKEVIFNKNFNGRFNPCKRIVLSEEFMPVFSEKTRGHLRFVPSNDEALSDNMRNDAMRHFMAIRNGVTARTELIFTSNGDGSDKLPSPDDLKSDALKSAPPQDDKENTGLPPPAAQPRANVAAAGLMAMCAEARDAELLNGADFGADGGCAGGGGGGADGCAGGGGVGGPPMPKARKATGSTLSKKDTLKAKKKDALARAAGGGGASGKKRAAPDSSDEEEDLSDEEEGATKGEVSRAQVKPPPQAPKKQKQTKLTPKISLKELPLEHALLTANPVGEHLSVMNAGGRFVLVPASQFGSEGIGGWVAKIKSVAKTSGNPATLLFKDADGASSTHYFKFTHVLETFMPLT